jgi:signal-transduction protein with cAMP-binding, CBS, and nucleotidyltransferase domain
LKNLSFECQIELLSVFISKIYLPEEVVIYENEKSEEMYFIQSGILEVKDKSRGMLLRLLEGDFFGEQVQNKINKKNHSYGINTLLYYSLLKKEF